MYCLSIEFISVSFSEAFGLAISDHPVQEIKRMLLVLGVSGDSYPVYSNRNGSDYKSSGNGEIKIARKG